MPSRTSSRDQQQWKHQIRPPVQVQRLPFRLHQWPRIRIQPGLQQVQAVLAQLDQELEDGSVLGILKRQLPVAGRELVRKCQIY